MDDLKELEQQVRDKLACVAERRHTEHEAADRRLEERERRGDAYRSAARHLMESIIRRRIERVIAFFPNVLLPTADAATESQWSCRFLKTQEFPASTKLSFLVSPDAELRNAIVTYDLEILPIYFDFQGHDQLAVPIEGMCDASVAAWVDAKLLGFVDTYLKSQTLDQYQFSKQDMASENVGRNDACDAVSKSYQQASVPDPPR